MDQISAQALQQRLQNGEAVNLLDVREKMEYHTYNIGGFNLPLPALHRNISQLNYNKTDEIVVICQAGLRSQTAQAFLIQQGYQNVKNLTGGLTALRRLQ
jgi:adenylyltransferase/sulfurtransferase